MPLNQDKPALMALPSTSWAAYVSSQPSHTVEVEIASGSVRVVRDGIVVCDITNAEFLEVNYGPDPTNSK